MGKGEKRIMEKEENQKDRKKTGNRKLRGWKGGKFSGKFK